MHLNPETRAVVPRPAGITGQSLFEVPGVIPKFHRTRERSFSGGITGLFEMGTRPPQQSEFCRFVCSLAEAGENRCSGYSQPPKSAHRRFSGRANRKTRSSLPGVNLRRARREKWGNPCFRFFLIFQTFIHILAQRSSVGPRLRISPTLTRELRRARGRADQATQKSAGSYHPR